MPRQTSEDFSTAPNYYVDGNGIIHMDCSVADFLQHAVVHGEQRDKEDTDDTEGRLMVPLCKPADISTLLDGKHSVSSTLTPTSTPTLGSSARFHTRKQKGKAARKAKIRVAAKNPLNYKTRLAVAARCSKMKTIKTEFSIADLPVASGVFVGKSQPAAKVCKAADDYIKMGFCVVP